jgi:predicted acyltransferase
MAGVRLGRRAAARPLAGGGIALTAAGLAWGAVFPINKALWTGSYVLFSAGTALVLLAALHVGLDGARLASGRRAATEPLVALGRNALLLFVVSGLAARTLLVVGVDDGAGGRLSLQQWVFTTLFAPLAAPRNASLLYAAACLAALYALLAALHRRRLYWTV